ncbi:MAG: peptidoglycan DD-metalloendopeptidase family protein [Anaerolineae bacterium]|nr:peptidoglycan DD-metalloendopeptidase family protein [Anaerolineae bacterium]
MQHKARLITRSIFVIIFIISIVPSSPTLASSGVFPEDLTLREYIAKPGDTLFSISCATGEKLSMLLWRNGISNPTELRPGQNLHLAPAPVAVDLSNWTVHDVALGEELSSLARRRNITWESLAQANGLLSPRALKVGQTIKLPGEVPSTTYATAGVTPLVSALRHDVPLWEVLRLNPNPVYRGAGVLIPYATESEPSLPYPLKALEISAESVVRGQTLVLGLETGVPAECTVSYLGKTEPCYNEDETHLYVMIGTSPLEAAGEYEMTVHLEYGEGQTDITLPLLLEAGAYGRQWINPPASLSLLLNPDVYFGELNSLDPYRALRTPRRYWSLPLDLPFKIRPSISAGFGDSRSYAGMFETFHSGIDFRAWTGVPIYAPADGIVVMTDTLQVRGNAVILDHGWGLMTGYWHLSKIVVEEGQAVQRGEIIAYAGNTGLSTGAHLHWEMWVNGVSVNGLQWIDEACFGEVVFEPTEEILITAPRSKTVIGLAE